MYYFASYEFGRLCEVSIQQEIACSEDLEINWIVKISFVYIKETFNASKDDENTVILSKLI